MKTDTITDRLHAKADADLRKKITESMKWIWDETGHSSQHPKIEDFPNVSAAISNQGLPKPASMPWIGAVQQVHTEVAFAFLRDRWRSRYVSEFMGKVEAMADEMENLGIVLRQNEEEQSNG